MYRKRMIIVLLIVSLMLVAAGSALSQESPQVRSFSAGQCLITLNQATNTYSINDLTTPTGQVGPGTFEVTAALQYSTGSYYQLSGDGSLIAISEFIGSSQGDCVPNLQGAIAGQTWAWTYSVGTNWLLSRIFRPVDYQITFNQDGTYNLTADCNTGSGTYTIQSESSGITITPGPMTLVACGEDSLSNAYVTGLSEMVRIGLPGGRLALFGTDPSVQMIFLNTSTPFTRIFPPGQCQITLAEETPTYNPGPVAQQTGQVLTAGTYEPASGVEIGGQIFYSVGDGGAVSRYDISIFGGDCFVDAPAQLPNEPWQWTTWRQAQPVGQSVVPDPENYTIQFLPDYLTQIDGTAGIVADCNNIRASFQASRSGEQGGILPITLALGPTTQVFCGEQSIDTQFVANLNTVSGYNFFNDALVLHLTNGDQMTFQRSTESGQPLPEEPTLPPPTATPDVVVVTSTPEEPTVEPPTATPDVIVVTATPSPTPDVIVVTATPEPEEPTVEPEEPTDEPEVEQPIATEEVEEPVDGDS